MLRQLCTGSDKFRLRINEMKQGYMLTAVQCRTCQVGLSVQPPLVARTVEDVQKIAETVHASTKLICGKPLIIAVFVNALIADELIEEPLVTSENNGKPQIIL